MQKKVLGFVPAPQGHWVGDGFPVRRRMPSPEAAVEASADARV